MKLTLASTFICLVSTSAAAQQPAPKWYWCEPAKAYYPYVQRCQVPWREVDPNLTAPTPAAVAKPDGQVMFQQGLEDRGAWEDWLNSLSGDMHEGAYWWSGVRSVPGHQGCDRPGQTSAWVE